MSLSKSEMDKLNVAIGKCFAQAQLDEVDIATIQAHELDLMTEMCLTLDQARKVSNWCQVQCQRHWAQSLYYTQQETGDVVKERAKFVTPYQKYSFRGYRT
jgi:hypothetical protein